MLSGCAYFNTFYNAKQYYNEADKIRLEKDGQSTPIAAMDKYGKSIKKCKKVLSDYPESRFRIDAILLMAKSRYFRGDYDLALDNLFDVSKGGSPKQKEEARYWKALCKWKKGNLQVAIDELNTLLDISNSKLIQSKCHLSLAELSKELKKPDLALSHLKKGAKLTQDRNEKGVIYGRLAEMAYNLNEYDIAKDGYTNVIAHSLSKDKIEDAHLKILKKLRIQKKYSSASRKIKGMLVDDKFKRISGDLELELVNLYKAQGDKTEIETRLKSIVNDYQRTEVSAEAYYQLGGIYIMEKWDLKQSKEYFDQVSKESSRSLFSATAKSKSKSIALYQKTESDIEEILANKDSTKTIDSSLSISKNVSLSLTSEDLPKLYYQIADLEAFTFKRLSESKSVLEKIIYDYPESEYKQKSMFALIFIHEMLNDSITAMKIKENLIKNYPDSEYSNYLNDSIVPVSDLQHKLFMESENIAKKDYSEAIPLYKKTLNYDKTSFLAAPATFSIGYFYDQVTEIDSALKYYSLVVNNFPDTDQSKEASTRISYLNLILSEINQDSTEFLNLKSN